MINLLMLVDILQQGCSKNYEQLGYNVDLYSH